MATKAQTHDDAQSATDGVDADTLDERPYMVEEVDSDLVMGALFVPHSGQFYEVLEEGHPDVDPDTALTLKDPRTGDTFDYQGGLAMKFQQALGDHIYGCITVEEWEQFRAEYVGADESDIERAQAFVSEVFDDGRDGEGGL